MKRGANGGMGVLVAGYWLICAKPQCVRNIRNIQFIKEKNQSIHLVTRTNLFQSYRNTPERTGTNLFRHVPAMFRLAVLPEHGCILSTTGLSATIEKIVFRHVPVVPEHSCNAVSPERRGLRFFGAAMFRMFRTFRTPAQFFSFPRSIAHRGAPPWPS